MVIVALQTKIHIGNKDGFYPELFSFADNSANKNMNVLTAALVQSIAFLLGRFHVIKISGTKNMS